MTHRSPKKLTKVAFFGHPGSYTHAAAEVLAAHHSLKDVLYIPCRSIGEVFEYVETGDSYGVLPFKNNLVGDVDEYTDEAAKHHFKVASETSMEINHCLLARQDADIKKPYRIVSHKHALLQCSAYLKKHYPKLKQTNYANTSTAARDLAEGKLEKNSLVIASELAAELYGLLILKNGIQDSKSNKTYFRLIRK